MCHLYPYNNVKLLRKFFFTLIPVIDMIAYLFITKGLNDGHSITASMVVVRNVWPIISVGPLSLAIGNVDR